MEVIDLDELLKPDDSSVISPPEKEQKKSNNKKKITAVKNIFYLLRTVVFVFVAALFFVTFVAQRTEVNGSSMESTLSNGDNLIIDKISYRVIKPKRFDIIVFPHYNGEKKVFYIKRIIGLPGEQVQISEGVIYIDNVPLEENYGLEVMADAKLASSPIILGEDEYFVLGDNRNHSSDSREIGAVKQESIVGRAVFRVFPLRKIGLLK